MLLSLNWGGKQIVVVNAVLILMNNSVEIVLGLSERKQQLLYLRPTVLTIVRIAQIQENPEVYTVVLNAVLVPQCYQIFSANSVAALQTLHPMLTSLLVKILTIVLINPVTENANLVTEKAIVVPRKVKNIEGKKKRKNGKKLLMRERKNKKTEKKN